MPAPVLGLVWTLIDVALCRFWVLHPIYYLVESTILMGANITLAIIVLLIYGYFTAEFPRIQTAN